VRPQQHEPAIFTIVLGCCAPTMTA
jgi:hypothetical protein